VRRFTISDVAKTYTFSNTVTITAGPHSLYPKKETGNDFFFAVICLTYF
jgi:hypothetical protein